MDSLLPCAQALTRDCMGSVPPAGKGALYDHSGAPVKTWSRGSGEGGLPEPICLQLDEHLVSAAQERDDCLLSCGRWCWLRLLSILPGPAHTVIACCNWCLVFLMHTQSVTGLPSCPDLY